MKLGLYVGLSHPLLDLLQISFSIVVEVDCPEGKMRAEIMIAVCDVSASVAWYKVILGCSNDHDRPDFDRLMYNGKVFFMLHQLQAGEHGLKPPAKDAVGNGFLLWVFVEDSRAGISASQAAGRRDYRAAA
ncbi:hypothetical protein [Halomonas sp. DN3]|uniref:hypothetical protein n=1 Tax=Halomonas sp. DN3 TaxID=2953657 RepID=UPI0020A154CD|nr:hypothetical protein [Halomonas sp. DN3]USZ48252.1 hypothetical protein NKF27_12035 [Halomonas sp. DN3]